VSKEEGAPACTLLHFKQRCPQGAGYPALAVSVFALGIDLCAGITTTIPDAIVFERRKSAQCWLHVQSP